MLCIGAVHMPVKLYSATRSTELRFHYLHEQDGGRIRNERVCTKCGQTVDADELVRGYEVEKGTYVTLTEEDFEKVDVDGAHTLSVDAFVDPAEIDPILFDKPYYLVPEEKSSHFYALLREALKRTRKVAIANLVFHERELLAVIKPNGRALMLDVLYFSEELAPPKGLALPKAGTSLDDEEMTMAERLIDSMTDHFTPEKYTDTYREGLRALIEKKREGATIKAKPQRQRAATEEADLLTALKSSIQRAEGKRKRALAA
jgi:DNA end-binding protein Ku